MELFAFIALIGDPWNGIPSFIAGVFARRWWHIFIAAFVGLMVIALGFEVDRVWIWPAKYATGLLWALGGMGIRKALID